MNHFTVKISLIFFFFLVVYNGTTLNGDFRSNTRVEIRDTPAPTTDKTRGSQIET